jgi:hypothetical protein
LEAASTGKTLPSKEELLAFQARWMRPAGICAILGALIIAISLPLQPSGGGDNDAEQLTNLHDQTTELILGQGILIGIALLLFIPLLYVLFRAAQGRTERVRRGFVVLAFIGPAFFAISGVMVSVALNDIAGKFVDQAPARERQAREQAAAAQGAAATGAGQQAAKGQTTTAPQATSGETTTSPGTTTTTPQQMATPRTPDQAASQARDDLADDLIDDSGLLQAGQLVRFIGLFSLVFAMIYIPLWAMRTGLLTRFWAMLGVALGVSLVLLPIGVFGLVIWFAVVGLMLAGWWIRPLPPAWAAGEAIPWPSASEDIGPPPEERGDSGTVEGSGREVSEPRFTEAGEAPEQAPQPGETQGQRRRKRKRRK